MQFIGGGSQQEYVERTRGLDPSQCLAAGIDVGKYEALCLVADHRGEVGGEALTVPLTEPGCGLWGPGWRRLLRRALRSRSGSGSRPPGITTALWWPDWLRLATMSSSSTLLMSKRPV